MIGPFFDWKRAPVLGICGPKGSGRSAMIAHVKSELSSRGLRVAELAHVCSRPQSDRQLETRVGSLLADHDLVLILSDAHSPAPSIWCGEWPSAAGSEAGARSRSLLPLGNLREEDVVAEALKRLEEAHRARPVFGAVLIGGASRRMGFPKHLAVVGGVTLLERVLAALEPEVERTLVVGAGTLPDGMRDHDRVVDAADCGTGPLAGILTALRSAPEACWVIAACDMAAIRTDAVRWLLGERRPGRWAILPRCGDRVEPLFAVYEPQAYSLLCGLLAAGCLAPRGLAGSPRVHSPNIPSGLRTRWGNVNQRTDLERFK